LGTYQENLAELKRLLGMNFFTLTYQPLHPLKLALKNVLDFHAAGDFFARDYENASVSLLIKNLKEIEKKNRVLLNNLLSLLKTSNGNTYFGIRLEIQVSASLFRHGVVFDKTESPDFTLKDLYNGTYIECGSVHLSSVKPGVSDLRYKIAATIREKSTHNYCNPDTALFIDETNIHHYSHNQGILPVENGRKRHVENILQNCAFGSVVLFTYMINKDKNKYEWKYTRIDNINISELLKRFLDARYPFGNDVTHNYEFLEHV